MRPDSLVLPKINQIRKKGQQMEGTEEGGRREERRKEKEKEDRMREGEGHGK